MSFGWRMTRRATNTFPSSLRRPPVGASAGRSAIATGLVVLMLAICLPGRAAAQVDVWRDDRPKAGTTPLGKAKSMSFGSGFSFKPIRVNPKAGRKAVERGSKLYEERRYAAASIEYAKVLKGAPGSKYMDLAQYQLAKCLYRLKLYQPALDVYAKIIRRGPKHQYFRASLSWVILIGRKIRHEALFLRSLGKFSLKDFPRKHRDELLYLLGKFYFKDKRMRVALGLLERVSPASRDLYPRARYIMGVIQSVRRSPNRAARAFRIARASAKRMKRGKLKMREMTLLALARIHYSAKHFKAAIRYYDQIPRTSPVWLESIFEVAWAYFRRGKYEQALGNLHTLTAPYFTEEYYPEAHILRAVVFYESCRYADVKRIIARFLGQYRPLASELKRFARLNSNSQKFYQAIKTLEARKTVPAAGLDPQEGSATGGRMFVRLLKLTFQDRNLRRLFDYIGELDRELAIIRKMPDNWRTSSLARKLFADTRAARRRLILRAGAGARLRFLQKATELDSLIAQALKIKYETLGSEQEMLQRSAAGKGGFVLRRAGKKKYTRTVLTSDERVYWPFQGEFWVDELGYYRYRIKRECRR